MKLEDLLIPKTSKFEAIQKKMDNYYENATPEQIVKEFEELGVEFDEYESSVIENNVVYEINKTIGHNLNTQITENLFPDYLVIDPEVVGYPSHDFQEIIYSWVGSKIPFGKLSIKDLGCGRGDFGNWLNNNRPDAEYVGIDYNPTIINVGKQKYKDSLKLIINEYSKEDIRTDYTVCIGTLNEDNGLDKWENFNKTLIYALNNTKHSIFFVLARNFDLYDGYCDFPFTELFNHLDKNIMFEIDYSKLEDIYLLTINIGSFNT